MSAQPSPALGLPGGSWGLAGGSWGLAKPRDEAGAVGGVPSTVTLGSGTGRFTEAGGVGTGLWLGVATGPFPMATGGGMSSSSMALPFRREASRFSSVWEKVQMWVLEEPRAECSGGVLAPTCLPTHLKSPVIAPHLGTISSLSSTFDSCLVKGQPLLQGSLHPWVGSCDLQLWEGPGECCGWVVTQLSPL